MIQLTPSLPEKQHLIKCRPVSTGFLSRLKNLKTLSSANIHPFELSRVKLYESDLNENKNYFELAGVSSYRGFELPTVNYSKGNPGEIDSGSS